MPCFAAAFSHQYTTRRSKTRCTIHDYQLNLPILALAGFGGTCDSTADSFQVKAISSVCEDCMEQTHAE
jgi:hypothetical protein